MARHRRRFGILARTIRDAGGTVDSNSPAGIYKSIRDGQKKATNPRHLKGAYLERYSLSVKPFGKTLAEIQAIQIPQASGGPVAADGYLASVTVVGGNLLQANAALSGGLGVKTDITKSFLDELYYPAIAQFYLAIAANISNKVSATSQYTGRTYKRITGARSTGIPFGQIDGKTTEDDQQELITETYGDKALGTNHCIGISYKPEQWVKGRKLGTTRPTDENLPTDVPTNS